MLKGCERAAPASHESQLAYGSLVFAAGGNPNHHRHRHVTDNPSATERREFQTSLDLRYVRDPVAYALHKDRTASLQLYDDGTWYCYGACRAGGSIFDFAARVWRMDTKDRDFLKLRTRLAEELGVRAPK